MYVSQRGKVCLKGKKRPNPSALTFRVVYMKNEDVLNTILSCCLDCIIEYRYVRFVIES